MCYSELYCPATISYKCDTQPTRTCIYYGDAQLTQVDSLVALRSAEGETITVGSVTVSGLEINVCLILQWLYHTEDVRYFINSDLRLGELRLLEPSKYAVELTHPISLYPPEYSFDISFWLPAQGYDMKDFLSLVYKTSNHLIRDVILLDTYIDDGKTSHCYRIIYQSLQLALSYSHAYGYYQHLRQLSAHELNVILR